MKKINILVFPAGTEIGLEIYRSLRFCKEVNLFGAGVATKNHGMYVFDKYFSIPSVDNPEWMIRLNDVIHRNEIDYIFPAHDSVIKSLADNKNKINTKIISSPIETCVVTRSKKKTVNLLADLIPTPTIYKNFNEIEKWPVFLKPDVGQGSQGTYIANSINEIEFYLQKDPTLLIMDYLPGKEYTVDCFSHRTHGLMFCSGRERVRVKNGISMNSRPIQNDIWKEYANKIASKLTLHGAWFFQLKKDYDGTLKLLEVAPRIGGTMATHRVIGVNFALLSIYEAMNEDVSILLNSFDVEIDRALKNSFKHTLEYEYIYVDFDDTLVLDNKVNTTMIQFLYQSRNENKKIILITKSRISIKKALSKYSISEALFDDIIHLKPTDNKSKFITNNSSIFIDDSFNERQSVAKQLNIPTFDCSMINLLLKE